MTELVGAKFFHVKFVVHIDDAVRESVVFEQVYLLANVVERRTQVLRLLGYALGIEIVALRKIHIVTVILIDFILDF